MSESNRYIALLRAINVGGHRKIKMADLRGMFTSMGFEEVTSYIQSGNIIFNSSETNPEVLSHNIEAQISSTFGFDVPVIIRTSEQFESLIGANPFKNEEKPPFKLYVTFFNEPISSEKQLEFFSKSSNIESYKFANGELFSLIDKETAQKTYFSNNYVEKIAGIPGTTRNWRSVNKILELA